MKFDIQKHGTWPEEFNPLIFLSWVCAHVCYLGNNSTEFLRCCHTSLLLLAPNWLYLIDASQSSHVSKSTPLWLSFTKYQIAPYDILITFLRKETQFSSLDFWVIRLRRLRKAHTNKFLSMTCILYASRSIDFCCYISITGQCDRNYKHYWLAFRKAVIAVIIIISWDAAHFIQTLHFFSVILMMKLCPCCFRWRWQQGRWWWSFYHLCTIFWNY